jgi:hypothetical protein
MPTSILGDNMFNENIEFRILQQHFSCLDIADNELKELYNKGQFRLNASEITDIVKIIIDEFFTNEKIINELNAYLRECETYTRYKIIDHDVILVEYDQKRICTPRFKVNVYGINPKHTDNIKNITLVSEKELKKIFYHLAFTWIYTRVQMHMKQIIFDKCLKIDTDKQLNMMDEQWIIKGTYDELVDTYLILSTYL